MLGANQLIFAFDPKLEMDAETLVLHSGPKFLCFIVYFYKYFWFWYQTGILSEKVLAWQTTRKLIKSSKNIGGKLTHFCLGAKTWIGRWDPHFALRSKIFVFCSTFWWVLLILVPNRNCVWKKLCSDLANIRNHIS